MSIQLGNTGFSKTLGERISFTEFKKRYSGLLTGMTLEDAYKAVGGKIRASKKKTEEE